MSFTKIIGLDIGHGETAAVCMDTTTKQIARLNLDDNQTKVVPSIIGIMEDGSVVLGETAGKGQGVKEVIAYFKKSPAHFSEKVMGRTRGECLSMFVRQVVRQIFKYNRDILTESETDSIQLVVGCPSTAEWTDSPEREAYEKLLKDASGFQNTVVVPESRAALFSAFTSQGMQGITATDGVLVFDFGSSTADCTYINMGRLLMEYSWTLGAAMIEENMFNEFQELMECKAGKEGVQASLTNVRSIEFALRVDMKEKYYSKLLPEDANFMRRANILDGSGRPVTDDNGKIRKLRVDMDIDDSLMNKVSRETRFMVSRSAGQAMVSDSWYGHCKSFLEQAQKELSVRQIPCKAVMLTGGASKMGFVKQLCREIFENEEIKLLISDEPSFSVALGLAWTGMVDNQIEESRKAALEMLKKNPKCGKPALVTCITDKYMRVITPYFEETLKEWAAAEQDLSIDDLSRAFQNRCGAETGQSELDGAFFGGVDEWISSCAQAVQSAANGQASKIYGQEMAVNLGLLGRFTDRFSGGGIPSVTLPPIDMTGPLRAVVARIGNIGGTLAAIAGILGGGIGGLLVGGIIGLLSALFGIDNNSQKPRPAKAREKLLGKHKKLETDLRNNIISSLNNNLGTTSDDILTAMLDMMIGILALREFEETLYL